MILCNSAEFLFNRNISGPLFLKALQAFLLLLGFSGFSNFSRPHFWAHIPFYFCLQAGVPLPELISLL